MVDASFPITLVNELLARAEPENFRGEGHQPDGGNQVQIHLQGILSQGMQGRCSRPSTERVPD
jgi:hypothetical protein